MARDGSGNYNLPAGNPVVTGTVISSTQFNSTMTDIATAMTQSISKDGQTTPTNNLPMGGNKHTGVADGNLGNQYASVNQTQNGSLNKATAVANVVDAYTASLTPAIASYTDGQVVTLVPSATNTTTTVTLALNGLAAKQVLKDNGVTCSIGDIVLNVPIYLVYTIQSGNCFLLLNPQRITGSRLISPITVASKITISSSAATNNAELDIVNTDASGGSWRIGDAVGASAGVFTIYDNLHAALRFSISAAGNVSIPAPGSGVPLTLNGTTGAGGYLNALANTNGAITADFVNSSTGASATSYIRLINSADVMAVGISSTGYTGPFFTGGPTGEQAFCGPTSNIPLSVGTNNIERIRIANTGGVAINAPSSGNTVTAFGNAGGDTISVQGSATSSNSFGIAVRAGTTSADYVINALNQAGTVPYFRVRGDGVVFGNDGAGNLLELGYKDTPLSTQSVNYTPVVSDRGKTIQTGASVNYTINTNVFQAGAVLSFRVANPAVLTIVQGAGFTLQWAGNGTTTGSRTLTGEGLATILYTSTTSATISGAGLS